MGSHAPPIPVASTSFQQSGFNPTTVNMATVHSFLPSDERAGK